MERVYLDHAATTPVSDSALREMVQCYERIGGNPSSAHASGAQSKRLLDDARSRVAEALDAEESEVVFTSGATEADFLGVVGATQAVQGDLFTSKAEHKAVLLAAEHVSARGQRVNWIAPSADGAVLAEDVRQATQGAGPGVISCMQVNNETGSLTDVDGLGQVARESKLLFHVDAVQALQAVPFSFRKHPADLVSLSGHKIGGPLGIGVLLVRNGTPFVPLVTGGGQERGRRGGTENTPAAVGLAAALQQLVANRDDNLIQLGSLADALWETLRDQVEPVWTAVRTVPAQASVPHILSVAFRDAEGVFAPADRLVALSSRLGLDISSGSACNSGVVGGSHVTQAMGLPPDQAAGVIRLSLGSSTSIDDLKRGVALLRRALDLSAGVH
jgi:cysteine desulfurase